MDETLWYDFLVVATGAGMRPEEIPGLKEFASTIWTPEDMLNLRIQLTRLVNDVKAGSRRKVLFLVPPNNKCSGPLYEIVFMLDTWLRREGVRQDVDIAWSTYENGYIQAFGPRLDEYVQREFERRKINGHRGYAVKEVTKQEVVFNPASGTHNLPYDLLISFPPYVASKPFPGLPSDNRGFVETDLRTRQVVGRPEIYAVGDAGDFPVKQEFLAFLQADAAAEHLAASILGQKPTCEFEPTGMCVMSNSTQQHSLRYRCV